MTRQNSPKLGFLTSKSLKLFVKWARVRNLWRSNGKLHDIYLNNCHFGTLDKIDTVSSKCLTNSKLCSQYSGNMAWLGGDFEPNRWRFFRYKNANLTPNWQALIL